MNPTVLNGHACIELEGVPAYFRNVEIRFDETSTTGAQFWNCDDNGPIGVPIGIPSTTQGHRIANLIHQRQKSEIILDVRFEPNTSDASPPSNVVTFWYDGALAQYIDWGQLQNAVFRTKYM
jgi:hypothetical protein